MALERSHAAGEPRIEVQWFASGELAAAFEATEAPGGSTSPRVKEVKSYLQTKLQVPRVRQSLFHEGGILEDSAALRSSDGPWHLHLIVSAAQPITAEQQRLLDKAAQKNLVDDVEDILQICHPDSCYYEVKRTALHVAADYNSEGVAALLIEAMADVNFPDVDGCTALWLACARANDSMVQRLIDASADVHKVTAATTSSVVGGRGVGLFRPTVAPLSTPLAAVPLAPVGRAKVALRIMQILLQAGADINARNAMGETPAWTAALRHRREILAALIEFRADINIADLTGVTPLWKACDNGCHSVIPLLLEAGADKDGSDGKSVSPLLAACRRGHVKVCQLLVAFAADLEQPSKSGITPVRAAARAGFPNVLQALLAGRADPDAPSRFGVTPLILAISRADREKIVQMLLELAADKDKPDNHGASPLWMAALRGNVQAVEALLLAKADGKANKKGTSPLQIARKAGHHAIVDLLEETLA